MDFGGMDYQGGGGYGGGGGGFGGGFNGGGFNDSATFGGGGFSSTPSGGLSSPPPSSSSNRRRSQEEQTLLPVTVSMILKASSDTNGVVLADGRPLHHVKIVGAIRSIESHSTNTVFQIEDGTAVMDVKKWHDENVCSKAAELQEAVKRDHIYVAVYGEVKEYDGKTSLVAGSIRPIASGNELTHHMLEVIHEGEKHKKGGAMMGAPAMQGVGFGAAPTRAPLQMPSGSSNLKDTLMQLFREGNDLENGLTVMQVTNSLQGRFDAGEIGREVQNLADEGLIYTTANEHTFKSS